MNCDLRGSKVRDASFKRTKFEDSKLRGGDLSGCIFNNTRFVDRCTLNGASLRHSLFIGMDVLQLGINRAKFARIFVYNRFAGPKISKRPGHWLDGNIDEKKLVERWREWQKSQGYTPD